MSAPVVPDRRCKAGRITAEEQGKNTALFPQQSLHVISIFHGAVILIAAIYRTADLNKIRTVINKQSRIHPLGHTIPQKFPFRGRKV